MSEAPAGWYSDSSGGARWWDGTRWTADTRGPTGTSRLAVASLVLGLVWLWGIGSIVAFVLGLLALRDVERTGKGGRGLAIAGIVLGAVGIGGAVALIVLNLVVLALLVRHGFDHTSFCVDDPSAADC